ncbi:MAG TPA: glycosyltransferase [Longimicrobium sp.]|jgi:glycosyltransferase involved in cell wall biosynthesis|uniref:glycosyltransferase n=1 Tax=Longimicrobium sp. TaxID=2029185 RepID=UPI002ED84654
MTRPLRLLTVGHSYVVGTNRRLAHAMARAGAGEWEVTVAAPEAFPGDLGPITLEPFPGELPRLVPVPVHGARRIHTMRYGRRFRGLLREGWDVVHCWEEPFVLAGAQVAAWTPREARLVYATFQNLPKRYPPPFAWAERYALRRAAGWVAFGETVHDALRVRRGYDHLPVAVISPGVDTELFRPDTEAAARVRHSLGWRDDGPPVIGFLGRFVAEKGLRTLMAALDAVREPWRALIVGGGEMEGELRAWAAGRGNAVRIVTGVPHREVPSYLNAIDVLCAPSQTTPRWKEQLGRMLIEAMACGVAVIGSDSGEIPHVVGDSGMIVPEAEEAAWARAIDRLLADSEHRRALAEAGLRRVGAHFALPVVARGHLDFFRSLL